MGVVEAREVLHLPNKVVLLQTERQEAVAEHLGGVEARAAEVASHSNSMRRRYVQPFSAN